MDPVRWGIISTAKIGTEKVLPAMIESPEIEIVALASRDEGRARAAADALSIPVAYGSYEALLADPQVEAVYNPLPNHLHVPLTVQAADAGKHVLCEKPIGLDAAEAEKLVEARDRNGVLIQEAFMVRGHPQWLRAREHVQSGRIGEVRAIQAMFTYYNDDPANVRNMADIGGGALYDIGCYPINVSRLLLGTEPTRVACTIDRDPVFGTDRLTSAVMEFPGVQVTFTVSTQLAPYQRVNVLGTRGRLEVLVPFNTPPREESVIFLDDDGALGDRSRREERFPAVDQYRIQGELFSRAVRGAGEQVLPLEDSLRNMAAIDALFRAARTGAWVEL